MQLQTKPFIHELSWVQRFIEKKTTIPSLSNVLFQADGKRLTLTATDLEVGGITTLEGTGRSKWAVTAPVKNIIKYLGKIDEPEITLSVADGNVLVVEHGSGTTRARGMSVEAFPELPAAPATTITLRGLPLAIQRTLFAISKVESRFTLNGALLELTADKSALVATDGHRLSLAPVRTTNVSERVKALIPSKALKEAGALEGDCSFSADKDHVFFSWGQRRIVTRKLTGNFPEYQRVQRQEYPGHVMLPTRSTLKLLERVAVCADERSRATRFTLKDGKLTIFASTVESGEAEGSVAVQPGEGEGLVIGLNCDYVSDFLKVTDNQFVSFAYVDGKTQVEFGTGEGWRYTLMGMRI